MYSNDIYHHIGTVCYVSGYGLLHEGGPSSDVLRKAAVPIVNWNDCKKRYPYLPINAFCAGYKEGGADACPNDSGGPLICQRSNKRWVLMGVVSGGENCGDPGYYTYYANVVHSRRFVRYPGARDPFKPPKKSP